MFTTLSVDTGGTQLTDHERRPEGPSKTDNGAKLAAEKADVRPSLVIASDLPGQVHLGISCPQSPCLQMSVTMPAVMPCLLAAIGRDAFV